MPLETATHITDLNITNPANADGLNQADDHMRMIKSVLKTDIDDAMTSKSLTVPDGTSSAPSIGFKADATAGFYRVAAGNTGIIGRLSGNGSVNVGMLGMFLAEPAGLGKGGVGTGYRWLELDGSTWPNTAFPDLAEHLNQGGTTFTLPNAYNTGKFPRSRTATVTAGTTQANQNKAHTHQVTGDTGTESADHAHAFSGTTGGMNANNPHSHSTTLPNITGTNGLGSGPFQQPVPQAGSTGSTNIDHGHAFSGSTGGRNAAHTHHFDVTSAGGSADGTEARPEALSVVLCIKT